MTTMRLYFALWNRNRRISWTFHIQILYNKFTLHTLQTIFTLYTLFTDVIVSPELSKHCSRNSPFPNLTDYAPFCASLLHVQTCQITKTKRSHKKPVWRAILFQNRMEARFVIAVTRGVFFPLVTIAASPLNFHRKQQEKHPLGPRVQFYQISICNQMVTSEIRE